MAFDRLRRLRDSFRQNIWHVKEPKRELTNAELKSQFTFASTTKINQHLQDTTDENEHTQTQPTTMRGEPGQEFILRVSERETERSHNRRSDVTAWITQDQLEHELDIGEAAAEHERSIKEAAVEHELDIREPAVEHERSIVDELTESSLGVLGAQGAASPEPAALIITGSPNAQGTQSREATAPMITDSQFNTPLLHTPASSPTEWSYSLINISPQASDMGQSSSAFSAVRITPSETPAASPSSTTAVQGPSEHESTESTSRDLTEEGQASSLTETPSVENQTQYPDSDSQPAAAIGLEAGKHIETPSTPSLNLASANEDNTVEHIQQSNTNLHLQSSTGELELQRQLSLPIIDARPDHTTLQNEPEGTGEEVVDSAIESKTTNEAAVLLNNHLGALSEWTYRDAAEGPSSDSNSTASDDSETSSMRAWSVTANADDVGYATTSQAQPAQDLWLEEFRAAIMSRSLQTRATNDLLAISNGTADAPEQTQPFPIFFNERLPLPGIQPEYTVEDLHPAYLKVKTKLHLKGLGMPYLHKNAKPVIQHNEPRQHYKASITAAEAREFTEAVYDELWRGGIIF